MLTKNKVTFSDIFQHLLHFRSYLEKCLELKFGVFTFIKLINWVMFFLVFGGVASNLRY